MRVKDFLKPSLLKIAISIILFLVFVPFINYDTGIRCITTPCPSMANGSFLIYLIFSQNFYVYNLVFFNLIIGFIISYFFACIISKTFKS